MTTSKTQAAQAMTTTVAPEIKPQSIRLLGPVLQVLEQLAVHVRNGYVPDTELPVDLFGGSGNFGLYIKLGNPDAAFVQAAKVATEEAMMRQHAQHERDIIAAAEQLIADRERAAARAIIDSKIREQEATLAALKAAAAA